MSLSEQYNVGPRIKGVTALVNTAIAGTTATGPTTEDGRAIDRLALGRRYYSCKAIVSGVFIGNSTAQSASMGVNFQHSSDGTSWDNYSTDTVPAVTAFGPSSNSTNGTEYGVVEQSVNLRGARQYIRIQVPPITVSSSSAGNAINAHGVIVFGGGDELPAA